MTSPLKIIFAGTPDFAAIALVDVIKSPHEIVAVYSQPDRPKGRGRKLQASPVKTLALEHSIPVEQPLNFKASDTVDTLANYNADVMIVAAYGLLLPENVLSTPQYGCLNIHASLLPAWRGAAPIQHAILAGDTQTGITIMQMDKGLDTGDMLNKITCDIANDDTASSLHDKLALLGGPLMLDTLETLQNKTLKPEKQNDQLSTYAAKLSKSQAQIDWSQSADAILLQIRALNSWPVAQSSIQNNVIRIWQAQKTTHASSNHKPGTIIAVDKKTIVVACVDGAIAIKNLQRVGSKAMSTTDFLNGHAKLVALGNIFV
ncbi:Methionyl-tRNA formyltransferase [hydrothermal vent metagenome]|uniref:methionyl-tRNA formyltransferase n=1 Tax=hydrothermal vent metagenome TaxID=652676 RepID=A0A3B1AEB5_9ZZZZ